MPVAPVSAASRRVSALVAAIRDEEATLRRLLDDLVLTTTSPQQQQQIVASVNERRAHLDAMCVEATLAHIETAFNANVDALHWRASYHQLIEVLRKEEQPSPSPSPSLRRHRLLADTIEQGIAFYTRLVELVERHLLDGMRIDVLISSASSSSAALAAAADQHAHPRRQALLASKETKITFVYAHRLYIYMGDLARYKELLVLADADAKHQPSTTSGAEMIIMPFDAASASVSGRDYTLARHYYLKAVRLAPKSSRAYHQLAILAIYTRRRLDAAYYVSNHLISIQNSVNISIKYNWVSLFVTEKNLFFTQKKLFSTRLTFSHTKLENTQKWTKNTFFHTQNWQKRTTSKSHKKKLFFTQNSLFSHKSAAGIILLKLFSTHFFSHKTHFFHTNVCSNRILVFWHFAIFVHVIQFILPNSVFRNAL